MLKKRLTDEGNQTVTNCNALKMLAADGKMRKTDAFDMEGIFRINKKSLAAAKHTKDRVGL